MDRGPRELPVDRVDVWVISLAMPHAPSVRLSADEQARAARYVFERDRRRFETGRVALRTILAGYLRCAPADVAFAYGEAGKPQLDLRHGPCALEFNASGSGELAVCAVTCGQRVGIDIEEVREHVDSDLVRYALSEHERAEFEQIPAEQQRAAFYRTWTRKEAYLKAIGRGLTRPLASFSVSVTPGDPPRLVREDSEPNARDDWSFADLDPAPGWVGTLVRSGPPRPVRRLSFESSTSCTG